MWRPPRSVLGHQQPQLLLVAPWADQGLGIQAREYAQWAMDAGWGVHVWALACRKTGTNAAQVQPAEWNLPNITYTQQPDPQADACLEYCRHHGIVNVLVLEPARRPIFDFVLAMKGVRVWAVPNVEMIRRADLPLYRLFAGILCVNQHTLDNLQYFKVPPHLLKLWPFQLHDRPEAHAPRCESQMRFLIVGGFNADRRKQARKVMQAFAFAFRDRTDVHLTVLSQGGSDFTQIPATFPNITVRVGALSYAEVQAEYQRHHVVIMCSRAEGLGLPFYEAMRAGCALITLNTALYRELVTPDYNGWLIRAQTEPVLVGQSLIGNDDAIVHTYTFEQAALTKLFQQLTPSQIALAQAAGRGVFERGLGSAVDQWKALKSDL
jgi:glycosyltransferase involved in cell wall biosynthesis